jgi:hypothetical protein
MNINEQNKIIEEIINDIENLLESEQKKPINEIVGLIKTGVQMFGPKVVNFILDTGGEEFLKRKIKDKMSLKNINVSRELEKVLTPKKPSLIDIDAEIAKQKELYQDIVSKTSGDLADEYYSSDTYSTTEYNYNEIKLRFKDDFKLELVADVNKQYTLDYKYGQRDEFKVLTTKKTSQGYILNLKNNNLQRNVSLLIYLDNFNTSGRLRCSLQLTYKNGRYNGNRVSGDIEILSLR